MVLSNYQVSQLYQSLCQLRDQEDLYIPVRTGYKILKNIAALESNFCATELLRQKIIQEYGEPTDEAGTFQIPLDKIGAAQKELDDLAKMTTDFNIATIQLSEIESLPLSLNVLNSLYLIIDDEQ